MNNRLIIMINHLNPQWNRSTVGCLMQVSNAERVIDDVSAAQNWCADYRSNKSGFLRFLERPPFWVSIIVSKKQGECKVKALRKYNSL